MNDDFDEFVRKQVEEVNKSGGKIDPVAELDTWRRKLDELYKLVRDSLAPHIDSGNITFESKPMKLNEELLGSYQVPGVRILIGRDAVTMSPVGTFLVGARGRVDVVGPRGSARLVVVPKDATAPRIVITQRDSLDSATRPKAPPTDQWVWKIATPPPHVRYIDVTEESIKSTLMGVVSG